MTLEKSPGMLQQTSRGVSQWVGEEAKTAANEAAGVCKTVEGMDLRLKRTTS